VNRRRLVTVPASTANLGPGFDVLAAALSPRLTVEVEETGSFAVETELDVPRDKTNLIVEAFEALHAADDFTFRVTSEIPLTGGLGSSAAAILAGVAAADHIFELGTDLLAQATAIEGHPDNVAAPPTGLEGIIAVPPADRSVPTCEARAALPESVSLGDAVASVANVSFVVLGLERGDWEMLARGLHDRLHQPHRAHLYPESIALVEQAPGLGAIGATISGAGPTVLVWSDWEVTGTVLEGVKRSVGPEWDVRRVTFATEGLDVKEL
jgi:homoserine kinase